ncbi:Uncharacterised protein [Staphylococcus aureus]|nr:Uncharacterised protein [Staphylococcus aureus]
MFCVFSFAVLTCVVVISAKLCPSFFPLVLCGVVDTGALLLFGAVFCVTLLFGAVLPFGALGGVDATPLPATGALFDVSLFAALF